jgi:hypothetical protein
MSLMNTIINLSKYSINTLFMRYVNRLVHLLVQRTSRCTHIIHIGCERRSLGYLTPGFLTDGIRTSNQSLRIHLLPSSGQTDLQFWEGGYLFLMVTSFKDR